MVITARVMALPEAAATAALQKVLGAFADRHDQVEATFRARYEQVKIHLEPGTVPSADRQLLLGAYFTHEYSIESAALFNPSIVPHPDQTGLPDGALRFILSLRATGSLRYRRVQEDKRLARRAGEAGASVRGQGSWARPMPGANS